MASQVTVRGRLIDDGKGIFAGCELPLCNVCAMCVVRGLRGATWGLNNNDDEWTRRIATVEFCGKGQEAGMR